MSLWGTDENDKKNLTAVISSEYENVYVRVHSSKVGSNSSIGFFIDLYTRGVPELRGKVS